MRICILLWYNVSIWYVSIIQNWSWILTGTGTVSYLIVAKQQIGSRVRRMPTAQQNKGKRCRTEKRSSSTNASAEKKKHRVGFTNPLATSDEKSFAHRNIPGSGGSVLSTRHSSPSPLPCPEPGGTNLGFDVLWGPVRAARLGPRGPLGRPCDQVQPFSTYV